MTATLERSYSPPRTPRPRHPLNVPMEWVLQAACRGMDPEIFFPTQGMDSSLPKSICSRCPVSVSCLAYAEMNRETIGVWGGLSGPERTKLRRASRQTIPADQVAHLAESPRSLFLAAGG